MIICYECGKSISGKVKATMPPLYLIRLGNFPRSYHPKCYKIAEKRAEKELVYQAHSEVIKMEGVGKLEDT